MPKCLKARRRKFQDGRYKASDAKIRTARAWASGRWAYQPGLTGLRPGPQALDHRSMGPKAKIVTKIETKIKTITNNSLDALRLPDLARKSKRAGTARHAPGHPGPILGEYDPYSFQEVC